MLFKHNLIERVSLVLGGQCRGLSERLTVKGNTRIFLDVLYTEQVEHYPFTPTFN